MDPLEFRLTSVSVADAGYVMTVAGELDLSNAGEVDRELESLVEDGAQRLVVDLLEVPFLESTALGVLLKHARRLRMNGGELTLVTDDVRVLRVIEISGLTGHFRIDRSLGSAVDRVLTEAFS